MQSHDVMYELGHALDAYTESEGHTFELDHEMNADRATLTVTAHDGSKTAFRIAITPMTTPADMAWYTASFPTVQQAQQFAANAERVIRDVRQPYWETPTSLRFMAATRDETGFTTWGDISLSVGAYGGPGTTLNGIEVPREQ